MLVFCFIVKRKALFYFLALYLPAILVVAVTWLASMREENGFSDLLGVLLAQLFLYFSYITVMPRVSDVKAMEIFLMLCFLFIFVALLKTFLDKATDINSVKPNGDLSCLANRIRVGKKISIVNATKIDKSETKIFSKRNVEELKVTIFECFHECKKMLRFVKNALFPASFVIFCVLYFVTYIYLLHDFNQLDKCD